MSSQKSRAEEFGEVDKSKDKQYLVDYLDSARSQKQFASYKERSFSLLNLREGDKVLDIGCGTGEDVVSLARIVGASGGAVGIDNSETMILEARKRTAKLNIANVEFIVGSADRIDFPDETFNGCRADRVFQHLQDPRKALSEIIRVTRKGSGRITIFDPDWDTLIIDSKFKETTRRILQMRSDSFRNGWIGRQLYGMFKEAKLIDVTALALANIVNDYNTTFRLMELEQVANSAVDSGVITYEDLKEWLADLQRKQELGQYFLSVTGFLVAATRPV
jgi:ubiquinone/menaquinone biosynthesis C-methylase UbiE